ncbi:unnamed protein product [Rhizophagus irregularis]|nr:unnamed protein product [Rhizophagus irregularis]
MQTSRNLVVKESGHIMKISNVICRTNLLRLETDTENTLKILLDDVTLQVNCYEPQNFKKLSEISSGGFASVYAADWKNATIFAIKKFRNSCSMEEIINELLRLETDTENTLKILLDDVTLQVNCYEPQNFKKLSEISSGGFASVYAADWKNATIFAIKKFRNSCSMEEIINEVFLTEKVDFHPNIIKFCGVTKFKEFAKEIASAISWLHDDKGIIHGDLHPAVLFWQLTSCKPPFDSETEIGLKIRIINGQREIPIPNTNGEYVKLYQKCWELEPDDRPDISEIVTILKNNTIANFEENEITKESENYSLSCQV